MLLQELNVKIGLLIDEFQKNVEKVKGESEKIEGTFSALKGALVSLGVFSFLKSAIAEFSEAERQSVLLGFRLKNLGGDFRALKKEAEDYAQQMAIVTGINDDELKKSLNGLVDITKDAEKSMSLLQDVMDLHVGTGLDLKRATELVGRAFAGERGELTELGKMFGVSQDKAVDFQTVMKAVRNQVQGAATDTKMLHKSLGEGANVWSDFKENVGKSLSGFVDLVARGIRPTIDFLGKLKKAQDDAFSGLYKLMGNIRTIYQKGIKEWWNETKRISAETANDVKSDFEASEKKKTDIARVQTGKRQKWADDMAKRDKQQLQKERMEVIKAEDAQMRVKVSKGQATNQQLLEMMKTHAGEIKTLYGEMSTQYQEYEAARVEATLAANEFVMQSGQAMVSGISSGFEAMFGIIAEGSATADKIIEAFARSMAKSMLNAIASAVEAEAARGMVGYLANMLTGGPIGGAVVSAYSLPLIATMAATAGMVRGLANMMAEGGTLTSPQLVMMAEKPTGEPETAIPLSRMDEVFHKYSHFLGKRGMGAGKQTVINVQRVNDNRGAIVASSSYDRGRAAKNLGQMLVERGVIKK